MSAPIFCCTCGGPLVERFIEFEGRLRSVCAQCGFIAYRNPRVLVDTIVAAADEVLLCRRAIEPAAGRWALPGGFLECGESLEEAAARETFEETGVRLDSRQLRLHDVSTLLNMNQVYIGFVAELSVRRPEPVCGPECTEVCFFREEAVPWAELAYPDIVDYLRRYFRERLSGERAIHFGRIDATAVICTSYSIRAIGEKERLRESLPPFNHD